MTLSGVTLIVPSQVSTHLLASRDTRCTCATHTKTSQITGCDVARKATTWEEDVRVILRTGRNHLFLISLRYQMPMVPGQTYDPEKTKVSYF